jgi:phosphoglycerol geranylgeranyltransferase
MGKKDSYMIGQVEKHLLDRIRKNGAIHITLIDPEKVTSASASRVAKEAESCETAAIMVGGSTSISVSHLDRVVKAVKRTVEIPVILFPNNVTGISRHADAIWFMSLLNSLDAYFLVGAQVLGAPLIKKHELEAIPLGYIVVGEGSAVSIIGRVSPIPYDKPELAAAHALAAQFFGMRFVYLEAGSGAKEPVPDTMIQTVKKFIRIPLIVGGGIRNGGQAKKIAHAGADAIVTGNIIDEDNPRERIKELVTSIKCSKKLP